MIDRIVYLVIPYLTGSITIWGKVTWRTLVTCGRPRRCLSGSAPYIAVKTTYAKYMRTRCQQMYLSSSIVNRQGGFI